MSDYENMTRNSPVELATLDAFWASDMPEHDAFFAHLAMPLKPLDLSTTSTVAGLAATADEDAWLFGDKTSFAVREIRVTSEQAPAPATPVKTAPLTIDVQHIPQDDEDATSVLLEPILGSPVDELDAMAAFMVDDVDPFQEVVVTSDDEPMSPARTPYCCQTEEKKLDKLRATVAHLEKMYYARCHGRATTDTETACESNAGLEIQRVKMVRSIERLQRIAADVAQENYGFRLNKVPQRAREELFIQEMAGVLKSPLAREQLCGAIADKLCSDAIVATARRSAEAAMALANVAGEPLLDWDCRKTTDAASGVLTYTAKKEFADKPATDYARITTSAWQTLLAAEQFAASMEYGVDRTVRSHVLKRLSEDAILIAFDTVVARDVVQAAAIERDVCVAFRVRTTSGVMVGVSSVAPELYERHVNALEGVSYVATGMRWMQFSQKTATSFSVTAGGRVPCASRSGADSVHVAALARVMLWERVHLAATLLP